MSLESMGDGARKSVDFGAWALAGVAAVSLTQWALVVTIIAGLASILLAAIRVYDRLRFGPRRD